MLLAAVAVATATHQAVRVMTEAMATTTAATAHTTVPKTTKKITTIPPHRII